MPLGFTQIGMQARLRQEALAQSNILALKAIFTCRPDKRETDMNIPDLSYFHLL